MKNSYPVWTPDIRHCLCFLTDLYNCNLSYSTLNTARSALSSMLEKIDGISIGEHKLVVDFMKGVSRLRPAVPRYTVTWNPDKVLNLLKSWQANLCDVKQLTLKLVALLALTTGQRVQTLSRIKLSNIVWDSNVQIVITDILKTTTVVKSNPVLLLPPYHDKELCPVSCLKQYVTRTKETRNEIDELFLSLSKPFKAVTSQTISRWLVIVLKLAGINVDKFHAHSFRHASTSKASRAGVNVDTIMKRVGWTPGSKMFAKVYNRPISEEDKFANAVLTTKEVND